MEEYEKSPFGKSNKAEDVFNRATEYRLDEREAAAANKDNHRIHDLENEFIQNYDSEIENLTTEEIIHALTCSDNFVVSQAISALGTRPSEQVVDSLVYWYGNLEDFHDRNIIRALANISTPYSLQKLFSIVDFTDDNKRVDTGSSVKELLKRERIPKEFVREFVRQANELYLRHDNGNNNSALSVMLFDFGWSTISQEYYTDPDKSSFGVKDDWAPEQNDKLRDRDLIPRQPDVPDCFQMNSGLPWDPKTGDIILKLEETGELDSKGNPDTRVATNVAYTCYQGAGDYKWGYTGNGPHELAMNILNQIVPPGEDGYPAISMDPPYWAKDCPNFCSRVAKRLTGDFVRAFIKNIPIQGGVISGKEIRAWIRSNQNLLDPETD